MLPELENNPFSHLRGIADNCIISTMLCDSQTTFYEVEMTGETQSHIKQTSTNQDTLSQFQKQLPSLPPSPYLPNAFFFMSQYREIPMERHDTEALELLATVSLTWHFFLVENQSWGA